MVELTPIRGQEWELRHLYQLLAERTPDQSISHKSMPSYLDHCLFVQDSEEIYEAWYIIVDDAHNTRRSVGSIYLTKQNEIGVHILRKHQRLGYAYAACLELMATHGPRRYLWNVNPANAASIALARKMEFVRIQETYALET